MNIYQRINEVRKAVAYVKKDAEIKGYGSGSYSAVTHDMVTALVRDHLIKQGIVIVPQLFSSDITDVGHTKNGTTIIRYQGQYDVGFINMDDPNDMLTIRVEAHANDSGDKAPGKAVSYATKTALLKVLSLETGQSDESRVEGSHREQAMLERVIAEVDDYLEANDVAAVFLLSRQMGQEPWADVYNSGKPGNKVKYKEALANAEKTGHAVVEAINKAILQNDAGAAAENVNDMTPGGKRLLANHLGGEKAQRLGELLKSLETDNE